MPGHPIRCSALLLAAALAGCASTIRLDNEVRSYPAWQPTAVGEPAPLPLPGDLYRFERRPSQADAEGAAQQQAIEPVARAALEKVGLREAASDVALPRWRIEVGARSTLQSRWDDGRWPGSRFSVGVGFGTVMPRGSVGVHLPLHPYQGLASAYYRREVTLALRDARSGHLVYETTAAHDGPWADRPALWAALFDAALQGFPQPPAGPRRVVIEVPR